MNLDMTAIIVATITGIFGLLGLLVSEARKGRELIGGKRSKTDPSLMDLLRGISTELGYQRAHQKIQDERIEVVEVQMSDLDGRVFNLEHDTFAKRGSSPDSDDGEGRMIV